MCPRPSGEVALPGSIWALEYSGAMLAALPAVSLGQPRRGEMSAAAISARPNFSNFVLSRPRLFAATSPDSGAIRTWSLSPPAAVGTTPPFPISVFGV